MNRQQGFQAHDNSVQRGRAIVVLLIAAMLLGSTASLQAKDKKKAASAPPQKNVLELLDYSKIVWPNPPAITRIKYLSYFSGY